MVHTIRWMVQTRDEASGGFSATRVMSVFLLGGVVGGASIGGLVVVMSLVLRSVIPVETFIFLASGVCLLAFVTNYREWRRPRYGLSHQVPPAWRSIFHPLLASFLYAFVLGGNLWTRINSHSFGALFLIGLAAGLYSPLLAVGYFSLVGLLRTSTAIAALYLRSRGSEIETVSGVFATGWEKTKSLESLLLLAAAVGLLATAFAF